MTLSFISLNEAYFNGGICANEHVVLTTNTVLGKKLLFIGAGASYGARKSIDVEIPLGYNLLSWLRLKCTEISKDKFMFMYHAATQVVSEILSSSVEDNFEMFFNGLESEKVDEINKFLCLCLSEPLTLYSDFKTGFDNRQDSYDELIVKLGINENWSVISLNYDVLFEQALQRIGLDFHYDNFSFQFPPSAKNTGVKVYKPHGSINFRSRYDIHISHGIDHDERLNLLAAGVSFTDEGEPVSEPPIYYAVLPDPTNIHHIFNSTEHLVIANYRQKKDVNISFQLLKDVRSNALTAWKDSEAVVVIGVKPVPIDDDKFVNTLLEHRKENVIYVTASSEDSGLFTEKQPKGHIFKDGLSNFLGQHGDNLCKIKN